MINNIKSWLANHFKIEEPEVELYFTNENVVGFLIIWTIFEQKLFEGYMTYDKLKLFAKKCPPQLSTNLANEFTNFHKIYQDSSRYNNLINKGKDKKTEISSILKSVENNIDSQERLLLMLYVVYRYRNNIFHGNKGVQSWVKYEHEIDQCVTIMKALLESQG